MLSFARYIWMRFRRSRYCADAGGVTAIEFAILMPIFLLGMLVVLESGFMMFTEYVLQTSVQEAARLVRTGQAQKGKLKPADFKAKICRLAGIIMKCDAKVTVYMKTAATFGGLVIPPAMNVGAKKPDGTPGDAAYECGGPNEAVALIATYDWDFVFPTIATDWWAPGGPKTIGLSNFGNINGNKSRRLAAYVMFRNEPFPNNAADKCGI